MGLARPTRPGDADGRRQRGCGEARARQTRGPARGRRLKPGGGGGAGKGDGAGRSAAAGQAGVPDDRTRRQRGADRAAPPGAGPAAETETKTVRELSPVRRPRVQGPPHGGMQRGGRGQDGEERRAGPARPEATPGSSHAPKLPESSESSAATRRVRPRQGPAHAQREHLGCRRRTPGRPAPGGAGGGCTGAGRGLGAAALCAVLRTLAPGTRSQASPGPSAGRRHTADERAAATMPPAAAELAARHRASRGSLHGLGWGEPRGGRRRPGWAAL